jgi:hypothetical protein
VVFYAATLLITLLLMRLFGGGQDGAARVARKGAPQPAE